MVNEDCEKLPEDMAADFHTIVAKTLYDQEGQAGYMLIGCISVYEGEGSRPR